MFIPRSGEIWNAATCSTYVNCSVKQLFAFRRTLLRFTPRLHYMILNKLYPLFYSTFPSSLNIIFFIYVFSVFLFIQGVRRRSVTSSYAKPRRNESIGFVFNFISRFGYNFKEMRRKCLRRDRCQDVWMKRYWQDDITELETSFYAILPRVSFLSFDSSFLGHDTG